MDASVRCPKSNLSRSFRAPASPRSVLGIFGNGVNMTARRILDGEDASTALSYVREHIGPVVAADFCVWPLFDACLFTFVPKAARPTSSVFAAFSWNVYLSLASNIRTE